MEYRSGFISIMGSPNVGKSTLMNALVGQKVAITTKKAQTTRNKVTGILTRDAYQMIFLDTPGIHTPKNKLGEYMVRTAYEANRDVDLTIMVLDAEVGLGPRDEELLPKLVSERFLVILNKIDLVSFERVRELTEKLRGLGIKTDQVKAVSAVTSRGVRELEEAILFFLPPGPQYYPADMVTDRPERFIAAEIIREKALIYLREEVPHGIGVEIEKVEEFEELTEVAAVIYCEKESHKGIILGKQGMMMKRISMDARADLEMLFGTQVYLRIFVKVKPDWRNSYFMLKELGYKD